LPTRVREPPVGFAERKREHIIGSQICKQSQGLHTLAQRWFEKDLGKEYRVKFSYLFVPVEGRLLLLLAVRSNEAQRCHADGKLPFGFRTASGLRSECPAGTSLGSLLYVAHRQIRAYTFFASVFFRLCAKLAASALSFLLHTADQPILLLCLREHLDFAVVHSHHVNAAMCIAGDKDW